MSASDPVTPLDLDPGWSIHHVQNDGRREALALLLTARTTGADMAVDHFLDFIQNRGMNLDRFWIASDQDRPLACVLLVEAPGKAGMLFISPLQHDHQVPVAAALIDHASQPQYTQGLSLLQILLDPHQQRERLAAEQGRFSLLAHLQYLRRRTNKSTETLQLESGLTLDRWTPDRRKLFGDAILASYQGTLDCPGLLGLRQIDDIIAGHMGAGDFTPELWQVVHRNDEPCAVMLMNSLSAGQSMELAYLGVASAWRGRGLGLALLAHGIGMAHTAGAREMLLAVDEHNTPALALYRRYKFSATARKVAMLRAVIK